MMKYILGGIFAAALIFGVYNVASASSLDDAAKATHIIYSNDDGFCSATVVDKDKLLTANHCTDNGVMNFKSITYDEKPKDGSFPMLREEVVYVKVLRSFKGTDSALLGTLDGKPLPESFGKPVDIASVDEVNKNLKLGTPLWAIGYPKIQELTITDGLFTAKTVLDIPEIDDEVFYKTTVPVTGGSSGGALYMKFGDEYKLIGTTTAGYRDVDFMTYFASIESVHKTITNMLDAPIKDEVKIQKTDKPTLRTDEK